MENSYKKNLCGLALGIALSLSLTGCAFLHHVQIGDIDNRKPKQMKPVEVKVSETGVDLQEAGRISKAISEDRGKQIDDMMQIIGLFQMGPRTGAPVFSVSYIKDVHKLLRSECSKGYLTGINSIRETRKYPVISGEIVKVTAYCVQ